MPTDHWFHAVFRALPDLVRLLLPELVAGVAAAEPAYGFHSVVLKKLAHSPDGLLQPRGHPGGTQELPVVLLEVQMHPKRGFHRRLAAETFQLLQQQPEIEHLRVLVLIAHRRLALGSGGPALLRRFLDHDVCWVDLQALATHPDLDPALALLTLPVQPEPNLRSCTEHILAQRADLIDLILPILSERFRGLTSAQIMTSLGVSHDYWRHTRAFQSILEEGREDGLAQGRRRETALTLRLLERRCGPLDEATLARLQNLSLEKLETLALDLLDFQGAADLMTWLAGLDVEGC